MNNEKKVGLISYFKILKLIFVGELKIKDILKILDSMIELVDMLNPNTYKSVQKKMTEQVDVSLIQAYESLFN